MIETDGNVTEKVRRPLLARRVELGPDFHARFTKPGAACLGDQRGRAAVINGRRLRLILHLILVLDDQILLGEEASPCPDVSGCRLGPRVVDSLHARCRVERDTSG